MNEFEEAVMELLVLASVRTGYFMAPDFDSVHKRVQEIAGRPVFTHEMGTGPFMDEIQEKAVPAFREAIGRVHELMSVKA